MKFIPFKVFLYLLPFLLFSQTITYEVKYGFLTAGRITVNFHPPKVVVKGESGGLIGLFYRYKLYMVYNLQNETESFLYEKENSKERKYNFPKILQKKAWLPIVIKLLTENKIHQTLEVGNLKVILEKVKGKTYYYKVEGSKRTKKVILKNWSPKGFPEEIEIDTSKGTLTLERRF